jgi:LysM repeat protein/mannose-6-phosphate isomerase-like protein (cupin superfamily)
MTYSAKAVKRSGRRSVGVILAIFAVMAVFGVANWLQEHGGMAPTAASLLVLSGTATVQRADAGADGPLAAGKTVSLQTGDSVALGADSRARLSVGTGQTIELSGAAELAILQLQRSGMLRTLEVTVALHAGNALARFEDTLFQGARLRIETLAATVEAGGGWVACTVVSREESFVAVYEGGATVTMGEQVAQLEAGQGVQAVIGQPLTLVGVAIPSVAESPAPAASVAAPVSTLTEAEQTLFPPALTPTLPGDLPVSITDGETYTVQKGDTLYSIARAHGLTWETLYAANRDVLTSPDDLKAGQELRIPTP